MSDASVGPGGDPAVRTVAGARFSCQGCGFCCRFHQLGPVEPHIVADLDASAPATWWPPAAEGPWYHVHMGAMGPVYELAKRDGHCVFLTDDNRCAVHAKLGAAAKPGFCRLFPYQVVQDARGISLTVRDSCGGRARGMAVGAPLVDDAATILALARDGAVVLRFAPEQVEIFPGQAVSSETWLDWEAALLDALAAGPATDPAHGAEGLLAWSRDRLADLGGATLPAPSPGRATLATRACLAALDMTLQRVQQTEQPPSQAEADFVDTMLARIQAAAAALAAGESRPVGAAVLAYQQQLLADALLGKELHRLGNLARGLARFAVTARIAELSCDDSADADAFAHVHSRVARFTQNRSMRAIFEKAAPALDDLFLHAGG